MLPERLSNELCSLRPNEEKYTFAAVFIINKAAKILDYRLGRTVINSDRRFTYEEAQQIIEEQKGDYADEILMLNRLAQTLRKERFKKGAINFSSQEIRFKLDENAVPIGIVIKESKEAHQLVEEFMLLANRTVATYISGIQYKEKTVPFPYRVHDVPDEEKLQLFTTFASKFGIRFDLNSPEKIAASFNEMLQQVKGKPEQHVLESLGIRTMSKAVYTTENIGHYGLGFENYCHFTSPIRRYPDVLVHRILQECLDRDIHPIKQLEQQCRHCSDMERKAMEAERSANKYKQVEYMQQFVGEVLEAVISGVSGFGFWAETIEQKCEGMVSISDLKAIDDFEMNEHEYALVGRHTNIHFRIGDKIKIQVLSANLEKRQIDFGLNEIAAQPTTTSQNKKQKSKTNKGTKSTNHKK
jgi:ribonuclease R